jgi:putative hydrolase of the HAD superfamily
MACRAVLLDFFNTLTVACRRGPHHAAIARQLGCDPGEWIATLDRTYAQRARGDYGPMVDGLHRLAKEAGGRPTSRQVAAAAVARVRALRADAPLRPEALPLLRTLRFLGIRTAVVSDCWFELPLFLPRLPIGPLLDAKTFSVEVGATKPSPVVYEDACRKLRVEPEECVYVGDGGGRELTGAQSFGMTAVRLAAPDLGDHLSFDTDTGWTGPTIATLAELPLLLARAPVLINS